MGSVVGARRDDKEEATMIKAGLSLIAALLAVAGASAPALAVGQASSGHLKLGNLQADCRRGGGPAFADFQVVHFHHALRLAAQTTTSSNNANGEASANVLNIEGTKFHSIQVLLHGDCQTSSGFFEIFVDFTPPGGSSSEGTSFNCRDMRVPGHPGLLLLTPETISSDVGDPSIPSGSTLHEVLINEQCDSPSDTLLQVFVFDVQVNGHHVPFDFNSASAFCSP
jgi:hypothetical protein